MDYLAIVLALLSAAAGWFVYKRPAQLGVLGIAIALLALALIAQDTAITQHHWVNTH